MNKWQLWIVSVSLTLTFGSLTAAAETFKCRSSDGKVSYSGQDSMSPNVKCTPIFSKKVVSGNGVQANTLAVRDHSAAPENNAPKADNGKNNSQKDSKEEKKNDKTLTDKATSDKAAADKEAELKIRQENCKNAKANVALYQLGGRMATVDEKGEKVYLEDDEIQKKLETAKKDVEKWCNNK